MHENLTVNWWLLLWLQNGVGVPSLLTRAGLIIALEINWRMRNGIDVTKFSLPGNRLLGDRIIM